MNKKVYSFAPGMQKLKVADVKCAKSLIMSALSIKTDSYFSVKKRGIANISLQEYEAVNEIFGRFGIRKEDVWAVTNA